MKKTLFIAFSLLLSWLLTDAEGKVNDNDPIEEPTENVDEVVEEVRKAPKANQKKLKKRQKPKKNLKR